MNKTYIFKPKGGYGPRVEVTAKNKIEAYKKARETLASLNMSFELKLQEIRK